MMRDISLVKNKQETLSKEYVVNKIQDILWDDVFEKYILHHKVIIIFILSYNIYLLCVHSTIP